MLEGNSGSLWSKLLLKAGSTMKAEEVAQGFFQLSSKGFQGWRLHSLSGKPSPLLGCCRMNHVPIVHFNLGQLPLTLPPCAIQVSDYFPLKPFL